MVKRDFMTQVILLVSLVLGIIALRVYLFEPVTINDQMANHYLGEGDVVIALKEGEATYGDFLLYEVDGKEYVGRVIAQAGDTVTYMDDVLYRNDQIVEENYLKTAAPEEYFTEDLTIFTLTDGAEESVPAGHYLVLNDNRSDKRDSRQFGLIEKKQVIGHLTFRLAPFSGFGFIQTGVTQ